MNFRRLRKTLAALLSPLTFAAVHSSAQTPETQAQPNLTVPDGEVRKYSSKYVLRHSARRGAYIH